MARPHRGGFESWLRGGQTIGHTIDMTLEVILRLGAILAVWAILCGWLVNHNSNEAEQYYGWMVIEATVLDFAGPPLPQRLSIKSYLPSTGKAEGPEVTHEVSAVAHLADVVPHAKAYFARARFGLLLWFAGALLVGVGTLGWYTGFGKNKMKARQIRGQEVIGVGALIRQIDAFNRTEASERGLILAPGLGTSRASTGARREPSRREPSQEISKLYAPARLVGVPYPFQTEMEHTLIVGSPGSGKSQAIHQLIGSIRSRGDRAVIFDPELEYITHHFDPATDVILNPFDERAAGWSPFYDAADHADWMRLAHAIFKDPQSGDPYWVNVARQLFSWTGYCLQKQTPNISLLAALDVLFGPTKDLEGLLEGTPAAKHLAGGSPARVSSLESVLTDGVTPLIYLHGAEGRFSIRQWVNLAERKAGFLFLSAPETHMDSLRPLLGFWSEIVVSALLSRHGAERHPTWVVLDEFPSLGKIDKLADGPQRLRKYGGAIVLGMQQVSQLQDIYGHDRTRTIIGQCATKLILRAQDPETAEFMSQQLGRRVMRRVEENTSYGANAIRDGVGLTPREELEPVVLAEDVMNFPKFQGMIRVSNARLGQPFPIAPLRFEYISRPKAAEPFIPRAGGDPVDAYLAYIHAKRGGAKPRDPRGAMSGPISPAGSVINLSGQAANPADPGQPGARQEREAATAALGAQSAGSSETVVSDPRASRRSGEVLGAAVEPAAVASLAPSRDLGPLQPARSPNAPRPTALQSERSADAVLTEAARRYAVAWRDAQRSASRGLLPHQLAALASTGAALRRLHRDAPTMLADAFAKDHGLADEIAAGRPVAFPPPTSAAAGGSDLEAPAAISAAAGEEQSDRHDGVGKEARLGDMPTEAARKKIQRENDEEAQRQRNLMADRHDPDEGWRPSVMMKEGGLLTEVVAPAPLEGTDRLSAGEIQKAIEDSQGDPAALGEMLGRLMGGAGILDLFDGAKRPTKPTGLAKARADVEADSPTRRTDGDGKAPDEEADLSFTTFAR